eukprot:gene1525-15971_t
MKCLYQLNCPSGEKPMYKCLAASKDSRMLAAAGRSHFIHLWNLDSQHLIRIIQLPSKTKEVRNMAFVNDSLSADNPETLAVLAQDGILRFINVNECKLMYEIGSNNQRILRFVLSPTGRYCLCVLDDGSLSLYSLESLSGTAKKVPGPVVQDVVERPERRRRVAFENEDKEKPEGAWKTGVISGDALMWQQESSEAIYRDLPDGLDMKRLLKILKGYGEYPEKYRLFIWRSLLRLPENHVAFSVLVDKGTHNAFARLHENFPVKSRRLLRSLERVLSALAYWSPIFGETDFLPMLAFPFVKLCPNNQLICFEFIATVITTWCQKWFEFFPNPPLTILGMIETVLAHSDRHLMEHLVKHNVTTQEYAWPLMQTLFSEVVTKDDWLKLWDNIFSNHPSFLLFVIVAYLIANRQTLLSATDLDDFKFFFHHRNPVDISSVIKDSYRLFEATPDDIHPRRMLDDFVPLTKGQYPIFDKYPKFVVDYLIQERERIRKDEMEYLRQKQMTLDLQKEAEKTRQEEEAFYRQQELMIGAEQQRRSMILNEEKKLADQRTRLQAMKREIALRELKLLDAVRRKFMTHQQKVQDVEIQRLDDELERKMLMRDDETKRALDDMEIKSLELEAQKRLFQQELLRDDAEHSMRYKADLAINYKRNEMEDKQLRDAVESSHAIKGQAMKDMQSELANAQQKSGNLSLLDAMEQRKKVSEIDREIKALELARANVENEIREEEMHNLMNIMVNKERDRLSKVTSVSGREKSKFFEEKGMAVPVNEQKDAILRRRDDFEEKQYELLGQINSLRRKLAQKDQRPPSIDSYSYR